MAFLDRGPYFLPVVLRHYVFICPEALVSPSIGTKDRFDLGFDFRNNMSYSSLFNLLFSLFPFTLIFLPNILITPAKIMRNRMYHMLFIFTGCILVTIYQMDFLSIFILFFLIGSINHLTRIKTTLN